MCDNEDIKYDDEAKIEIIKEFINKIYPNDSDLPKPEFNGDYDIDFWELL